LVNDFGGLFFNLISYINREPFSPIFESFSFPVLLSIFRMGLSIALEVAWMLLKPEFDPRVIGMAMIRMLLSPPGTVLSVQRLLAGGRPTGLPPLPYPWIDCKELLAIRTLFRLHLGFPSALE
jgi:hypothetical protein